jgi:hypothetical protein
VTRYVVVTAATVAGSGYTAPARPVAKGQVVELSAAEVTAIGAGNLRAVTSSTQHDQLGESAGVSNGN